MKKRFNLLMSAAFLLTSFCSNAQLFETRSTYYGGDSILTAFHSMASKEQIKVRESIKADYDLIMTTGQTFETFYDGFHLGLVVYSDGKPNELIGFWNPKGEKVYGGSLVNGTGVVNTPFNRDLVVNFRQESVQYVDGMKTGPVFYYCDCANVLRRGTFNKNVKEGVWEEFKPSGEFIKKKKIKVVTEPIENNIKVDDWIGPAHCMMKAPNEIIKCPGK